MLSLEKRKVRAGLTAVLAQLMGSYREDRAKLFAEVYSKRARGNGQTVARKMQGQKYKEKKEYMNIRRI